MLQAATVILDQLVFRVGQFLVGKLLFADVLRSNARFSRSFSAL